MPECKMLLLGDFWGENEEMVRQHFVGSSGQELWRLLGEAIPEEAAEWHREATRAFKYGPGWHKFRTDWLSHCQIVYDNVFPRRVPGNQIESLCETKKENPTVDTNLQIIRGHYLRREELQALNNVCGRIAVLKPNLIVALGPTALWATLRTGALAGVRGSIALGVPEGIAPGIKVLATFHPQSVMRQWSQRTIVLADFMKAWREAQFPEVRRPERRVVVNPDLGVVEQWASETIKHGGSGGRYPMLSIDIETMGRQISVIGFARSSKEALVIPFFNPALPGGSYWPLGQERRVWGLVKELLECSIPKLFQNGMYDLQYILRMGLRPANCLEDTMLLHHAHFPEMLKGLGFLGSIYTNESSWKLMNRQKADTVKRDE